MATRAAPRRKKTAPRDPSRSPTPEPVHTPENVSNYDDPEPHHTPFQMEPDSLQQTNHTRDSIHPYIEQDLRDSEVVDIYPWVEAAFGVPRDRIDKWKSKIGDLKWFDDEIIQRSMSTFCQAADETKRYKPFCQLANRIVALARGNLPYIPASNSYPVDSITFGATSSRAVAKIPEHGELGATRLLDVTVTHRQAYRNFLNGSTISWTDILHSVELKRNPDVPLAKILAKERQDRGKVTRQRASKANTSKSKAAGGRPNRRQRETGAKPRLAGNATSDVPVSAGTKRKRDDFDILAGTRVEDDEDTNSNGGRNKKPSPKHDKRLQKSKEAALQAGSYALEVLSCTYGTRVCSHSTVLMDDLLVFMYFDACGIVYTRQRLSLIVDFELVAAIILALVRCTPDRFGALPTSIIKPPTSYRRSFPPESLTGNVLRVNHPVSGEKIRVTLEDSLYSQYVLSGRRTFAYTMKASPQLSEKSLMAKFSYQVNTRRPEYELVCIARKAGVQHLPEIHMWADLWKMSNGARRAFYEGHNKGPSYEDRMLRMIVYTEYGSIRTLFSERCDLMPVMVNQMIKCLHDLRYKANMLHRDISVNNIMFQMRGGKYYFILNDFDMAIVLQREDGSSYTPSKHRTGTLPFMAVSLIHDAYHYKESPNWKPTRHLLRHDYESLFWVCLWCIIALQMDTVSESKQESYRKMLKKWECSDLDTVQASKLSLSVRHFSASGIALPPAALCLEKWLDGWNTVLWNLVIELRRWDPPAKPPASYDIETANGIISKENLLKTLTPLMPFTQSEDDDQDEVPDEVQDLGLPALEVPTVAPKRRSRVKTVTAQATAAKAAMMSKLRPRKAK